MTKQRGVIIVIVMVMLATLSFLAVSTIRTSDANVQLVTNQEFQDEARSVARNAVNFMMSDLDYFIDPASFEVGGVFVAPLPADITQGYDVTLTRHLCTQTATVAGDSLVISGGSTAGASTFNYFWEIQVQVADTVTGTEATYTSGFKFEYLAGSCQTVL